MYSNIINYIWLPVESSENIGADGFRGNESGLSVESSAFAAPSLWRGGAVVEFAHLRIGNDTHRVFRRSACVIQQCTNKWAEEKGKGLADDDV